MKQNASVTVELKVTSQRLLGKRVRVGEALRGLTLTVGLLRGDRQVAVGHEGQCTPMGTCPHLLCLGGPLQTHREDYVAS